MSLSQKKIRHQKGTAISEIGKAQIFCNPEVQQTKKVKDKVTEMGGSVN